jgi:hypothetical protein
VSKLKKVVSKLLTSKSPIANAAKKNTIANGARKPAHLVQERWSINRGYN